MGAPGSWAASRQQAGPRHPHPPALLPLLPWRLNTGDRDTQAERACGFYEGVTRLRPSTGGLGLQPGPAGPPGGGGFWLPRGHTSKELGRWLCRRGFNPDANAASACSF